MSIASQGTCAVRFSRSPVDTSLRTRKGILCPSFFDETAGCGREVQIEVPDQRARGHVRESSYVRGTDRSPWPDMARKVHSSVENTGDAKTSSTSSCAISSYDSYDGSFLKTLPRVAKVEKQGSVADRVREHAAPLSVSRISSVCGKILESDEVSPTECQRQRIFGTSMSYRRRVRPVGKRATRRN